MNIVGIMNKPAPKVERKSEADKWWDGLPRLNNNEWSHCKQLKSAGGGYLASDLKEDNQACFNEGLKWDKGFKEWRNGIHYYPQGMDYTALQWAWQSIHAFKKLQAEGKV